MRFPVVIGDLNKINDGLIGYFKQTDQNTFDYSNFYSETAPEGSSKGVCKPQTDTLELTAYDEVNKKGNKIIWTPPASTAGSPHYYLICWIDDTADGSTPPPFSSLPNFNSPDELGNYITGKPEMTFLDTWYQGIFLRQYAGQTPYQEGNGARTCPDIIVTNTNAAPDRSVYATTDSYNKGELNQSATQQMYNFVYIRGLNSGGSTKTGRVYLYYTIKEQLSPASWKSDTFYVAGQECNYVDLTADANGIVVSQLPVVWQADTYNDYILIAYVDDSNDPKPPDFQTFGWVNETMITQFVYNQPRAKYQPDFTFL